MTLRHPSTTGSRLAAFIAASLVAFGAHAQTGARSAVKSTGATNVSTAPKPAQIDKNGVLILVRTALLTLDAANKSGNYTVLRDLGSAGLRVKSDADLAEIFASLRKNGLDLSSVAVIEPQLTLLPQIEANGSMRMMGFFPSIPRQINFELIYAPEQGKWRIHGVSIALGSSATEMPTPPEPTKK